MTRGGRVVFDEFRYGCNVSVRAEEVLPLSLLLEILKGDIRFETLYNLNRTRDCKTLNKMHYNFFLETRMRTLSI